MRLLSSTLAISLLVAVAGCVGSLHPLYTTESIIVDDRIVGDWIEYDSVSDEFGNGSNFIITKSGKNSYILTNTANENVFKYDLHLVSVGDMKFVDLHLKTDSQNSPSGSVVRLHQFSRYELTDNKMRQFSCDVKKFEETLITEKVPFVKKDGQIVITAETDELHKFLSKHGKQIFSSPATSYQRNSKTKSSERK